MDRKKLLTVLVLLGALGLSACLPYHLKTPGKESPITVLGELSGQSVEEIVEAEIIISRGKHSYTKVVPVFNNEFEASLEIPVGEWDLSVFLVDAGGKVQYQSKTKTLHAKGGQPEILEIILRPAASSVHVNIELADYLFAEQVMRARIHFDGDIYEITRENSDEPMAAEIEVAPGSYEFKIELYTESFRIGDRLGPDSWQVIQVLPREDLNINWTPPKEELSVVGRVELLLAAPANLNADPSELGVHLSWDPVLEEGVEGYLIFVQTDAFERFQILTPTPIQDTSFLCTWEEGETPANPIYTVAAVSKSGLVGYYAPPLEIGP
ncbi:MAG TPA: hypothetical protein GX528_06240 [Firmicutes bacterium]|nr:hypothetical protein [Bacillota bacterium]